MTCVIAPVPGPAVSGYFVLGTECRDDAGLPHTLEHLIFLGSADFPFKGTLDLVANRCWADGTNAWTAQDHTAYTMQTMGSDGFLALVGPYLDHLLRPTLTDASFVTEVHHIDESAHDAGVVYAEMQAREQTPDDLLAITRARLMYGPAAHCGYSAETGGLCADIRELTNDRIKAYHAANYRPDNMCLVVCGIVDPQELFEKLNPVLTKAASSAVAASGEHSRPFSSDLPPFDQSVSEELLFPDSDPSVGQCSWTARGPSILDFERCSALTALWKYLTESAVSPLRRAFVDCASPLANAVIPYQENYKILEQVLEFDGVPSTKLEQVEPLLRKVLDRVAGLKSEAKASDASDGSSAATIPDALDFDLARMHDILDLSRRELLDSMETSPHSAVAQYAIVDFLYGDREESNKSLTKMVDELGRLATLKEKPVSFWTELLRTEILHRPSVFLRGKPSPERSQELQKAEKERVAKQKESLGAERLSELAALLQKSKDAAVPPPQNVVNAFVIPDAEKIPQIPIETIRHKFGNADDSAAGKQLAELPFPVQIDSVAGSEFFEVSVFFNTEDFHTDSDGAELIKFLELWLDCVYELPLVVPKEESPVPLSALPEDPGESSTVYIPHEIVVEQLDRDTTAKSNGVGVTGGSNFSCGQFPSLVRMRLKVERAQMAIGLRWLRHFLWCAVYPVERLLVAAKRLLSDVPSFKRSGSRMARAGLHRMLLEERSNHRVTSALEQQAFLLDFLAQLDSESPEEKVKAIARFTKFAGRLASPDSMFVHVVADLAAVPIGQLTSELKRFSKSATAAAGDQEEQSSAISALPVAPSAKHQVSNVASLDIASRSAMALLDAVDGAFVQQACAAPSDVNHPDVEALRVGLQYFSAIEGPFWVAVRGSGLAYGCGTYLSTETGALLFYIYRSPKPAEAYAAARAEINKVVGGGAGESSDDDLIVIDGCRFERSQLESARALCMQEIISSQTTMSAAARNSLSNFLLGYAGGSAQRLQRLAAASEADVARALNRWAPDLFNDKCLFRMIVANPSLEQNVVEGMKETTVSIHKNAAKFFLGPERAEKLEKLIEEYGEEESDSEDDDDDSEEEDDETE